MPWVGEASAGTSGANGDLSNSGTSPTVGVAVNGHTPATLSGAHGLISTAATTSLLSVGTFTIVVLFKASATVAAATDFYDDPALATDTGGNLGLVYTASGVRAGVFVGTSKQTTAIALATGAWAMCVIRHDGTNVHCRVSQVSGTTDATPVLTAGNPALAASLLSGVNYAAAKRISGDILSIRTAQSVISDANLVNMRGWYNTRYALALT